MFLIRSPIFHLPPVQWESNDNNAHCTGIKGIWSDNPWWSTGWPHCHDCAEVYAISVNWWHGWGISIKNQSSQIPPARNMRKVMIKINHDTHILQVVFTKLGEKSNNWRKIWTSESVKHNWEHNTKYDNKSEQWSKPSRMNKKYPLYREKMHEIRWTMVIIGVITIGCIIDLILYVVLCFHLYVYPLMFKSFFS